jgi:hypothetical protein
VGYGISRLLDRRISRAAAQVSGEDIVRRHGQGRVSILIAREQGHHETGCAKPALRSVSFGHGSLHWMERAGITQGFHRDQLFAVKHWQKEYAGIYSAIAHLVIYKVSDDHCAGPAISLCAPLFGACPMAILTQPFKHGLRGIKRLDLLNLAVQEELHHESLILFEQNMARKPPFVIVCRVHHEQAFPLGAASCDRSKNEGAKLWREKLFNLNRCFRLCVQS